MTLLWIVKNLNWIIPTCTTIVLAIINICFLRGQKNRQNTQICISLMEKRAIVYYEMQRILAQIITKGDCTYQCINELDYNTKEIEMLFGEDIVLLKKEIRETMLQLNLYSKKVESNIECKTNYPNHEELCNKEFELQTKITEYNKNLFESFKKYIDFSEYKLSKKVKK